MQRVAGGRRLLRRWLCRPLTHIPDIDARLDAVAELTARPGLTCESSLKLLVSMGFMLQLL